MSSMNQKPNETGWFYHAPPKRASNKEQVYAPPPSQIPGLGQVETLEREKPREMVFNETDTKYIRLAKMGGRKDLLTINPNPVVKKEAVSYPRCDWYYLEDNAIQDRAKDQKQWEFMLPEYMVHESYQGLKQEPDYSTDAQQNQDYAPDFQQRQAPYASDSQQRQAPYASDSQQRQAPYASDSQQREAPYASDSQQRQASYVSDSQQRQASYVSDSQQRQAPYASDSQLRQAPHAFGSQKRHAPSASDQQRQAPYATEDQSSFMQDGRSMTDKTVRLPEVRRPGYGVRFAKPAQVQKQPDGERIRPRYKNHPMLHDSEEPTSMNKLLSNTYEREWHERMQQLQEKQKLEKPYAQSQGDGPAVTEYSKTYGPPSTQKATRKESAGDRNRNNAQTSKRDEKQEKEPFKMSKFKNVPARISSHQTPEILAAVGH